MQLTDSDFTRLYTYVKNSYGIDLSKKKQLISSRLNNMLIQQGYRDFTQYTDEIISGKNPEMISAMLNRLTTNYTYFLREKEHFDFLQKVVLPELAARHAQDHTLSIWSAGCSSGEEPYTISMYLKEFFLPSLETGIPGSWPPTFRRMYFPPPSLRPIHPNPWQSFQWSGRKNTLSRQVPASIRFLLPYGRM